MKIDFKNQESIRILTKCLLKRDFELDVDLPKDKLVPTLPLRFNYILWIQDILDQFDLKENITGIDIGTGASCIYCLLASKSKSWRMFGTEIDECNLKVARENVLRNQLQDKITVLSQDQTDLNFFSKLFDSHPQLESVDFCMVNPPFFKYKLHPCLIDTQFHSAVSLFRSISDVENAKNRTRKRKLPKSVIRGSQHEIVCDGGEVEFVNRLIKESLELKNRIKFYSSMLGHKSSLTTILVNLREAGISNLSSTEFVQGKTTRWGVVWSFLENCDLNVFKKDSSSIFSLLKTKNQILKHLIPNPQNQNTFEEIKDTLKEILKNIQIQIKVIENHESSLIWELHAFEVTWRNQRRKRRERARLENSKVPEVTEPKIIRSGPPNLIVGLELSKNDIEFLIQTFFISGTLEKVCVGEILQFIKNNLKVS